MAASTTEGGWITSHVLDTAKGCPAKGIRLTLEALSANGKWETVATDATNDDGRSSISRAGGHVLRAGKYRVTFHCGDYIGEDGFYDDIVIAFKIAKAGEHYHIPLLLSPFGYTTYRGS